MNTPNIFTRCILLSGIVIALAGCSSSKQAARIPKDDLSILLIDTALVHAHTGILVQEAASGKIIAQHNADKYFVPASNTKLWTMYAALKHLGDSLVGANVFTGADGSVLLETTGDPTFLHNDYARQPVADILRKAKQVNWTNPDIATTAYGNGWSWNDYDATYMAPRSSMPMFGNTILFTLQNGTVRIEPQAAAVLVPQMPDAKSFTGITVDRGFEQSAFAIKPGRSAKVETTFYPNEKTMLTLAAAYFGNSWQHPAVTILPALHPVYSQPTDSMLTPLMHRSDNFFAEQTLLMLGRQMLGKMNERQLIDSLLRSDLQQLPHAPRWVDGSGLSRYNLFTPTDYVWLLQKMAKEFPMQRLQHILPTGNDGTLTNYYTALQGKLFAKTGTLAGVVALSGYLYAKSGKLLLFSTLVNNHNNASSAPVRRAIEKYLMTVYEKN